MKTLDNKKVFVSTPETSKAVQEKAFKLGFKWRFEWPLSDTSARFTGYPFLFFENGEITWGEYFKSFRDHRFEEITAAEIFAMENTEPEETFEVFQKVLVRDYDKNEWSPDFFGRKGCGDYPYQTVSGVGYQQCIDYKKNKHLAFTTGKP